MKLSILAPAPATVGAGTNFWKATGAKKGSTSLVLLVAASLWWPFTAARAQQACSTTGTNQTCTNSVTISGGAIGIADTSTLTLTNTGTVTGTNQGIRAPISNVTNSGTIQATNNASSGISSLGTANVSNSGVILANGNASRGVDANIANVTNSGTIQTTGSLAAGILANTANVVNSGAIQVANDSFGIDASAANVTNSGIILAGSGSVGIRASSINLTNTGVIQTDSFGVFGVVVANVTNSGSILTSRQGATGISAPIANVVNRGTIEASGRFASGVGASDTANVTNFGVIQGSSTGQGVTASNSNVINAGTIRGSTGVFGTVAKVTNSGVIQGENIGIRGFISGTVTNSGTIVGNSALLLSPNADSLTVLTGSRIIGAIRLQGGGDTVNFRGGNHNLTFDTLTGATVTGTTPFAVSGNQAAAIDLTPFAANWRSLADFTRAVSDTVPVFAGNTPGGGGPLAFAPDTSARIDDAFAAIPGLAAYSGEAAVFKAPTQVYSDGSAVWARGFAGQRIQQQDGVLLRNASQFYGGMLGADFMARADLRGGFYVGGGKTRTSIDLNQGGNDSDLFFGGAYARYDRGQTFLHGAVQTGISRNNSTRIINNNTIANGLETAAASFNGWYVSPEATVGHRLELGRTIDAVYTLTPSLRVRYLYGSYDGYTETGTTAPLTVFGQTVSAWEERGEAKLTRTVIFDPANQLSASITGGVLGTQRAGGSTINATLLGQAIPFATPGQANVWGGFGGLGLEWRSKNVSIFSAAEYLALSDNANIVSGRAGLRVGF